MAFGWQAYAPRSARNRKSTSCRQKASSTGAHHRRQRNIHRSVLLRHVECSSIPLSGTGVTPQIGKFVSGERSDTKSAGGSPVRRSSTWNGNHVDNMSGQGRASQSAPNLALEDSLIPLSAEACAQLQREDGIDFQYRFRTAARAPAWIEMYQRLRFQLSRLFARFRREPDRRCLAKPEQEENDEAADVFCSWSGNQIRNQEPKATHQRLDQNALMTQMKTCAETDGDAALFERARRACPCCQRDCSMEELMTSGNCHRCHESGSKTRRQADEGFSKSGDAPALTAKLHQPQRFTCGDQWHESRLSDPRVLETRDEKHLTMHSNIQMKQRDILDRQGNPVVSELTGGWHVPASARASRTRNPIRELVQNWKRTPNARYEPIDLSIGDPTAYGNIHPPSYLLEHFMEVVRSGRHHGYTHSAGMETARLAVANHFNRRVDREELAARDVFLASGVSGALELALAGLLDEGDNILVPCPGFPLLRTIAEHLGASVREYPLMADQDWQMNLSCLEQLVDGRTRALVVNNPSNPCGSVWSTAHMEDILRVAAELRLPILSDEVYADMVFSSSRFAPFGMLSLDVPVISVSGISKQFAVPGWRLGWVVLHDRDRILERAGYRDGLQRLTTRMLLPNALAQAVLPVALGEQEQRDAFLTDLMQHLATNAALFSEKLADVPGLRCIMPQGAMYMMIRVDCSRFREIRSTMEFCQQLYAEESVLTLPGECFGASGFIRVVTFPPQAAIAEACVRIQRFCTRRAQ